MKLFFHPVNLYGLRIVPTAIGIIYYLLREIWKIIESDVKGIHNIFTKETWKRLIPREIKMRFEFHRFKIPCTNP